MWYRNTGSDNDVVVSSRVRLARTLADYPMEGKITDEQAKELIGKIRAVFEGKEGWQYIDYGSLSVADRAAMTEMHLVSREFAEKKTPCALIQNTEASVYIMVMEEDHLRIQCVLGGSRLKEAMKAAIEAEAIIDEAVELAFSEELGYITRCPTNLGTGLRASVMLHLPLLTRSGAMRSLPYQLPKMGLTIRGMEGEGSNPSACLYQISNEVTLGVSEEETIQRLEEVIAQLMKKERELRSRLGERTRDELTERSLRSLGSLMYASRLSSAEVLGRYSELRLSAAMGWVKLPAELCDELLFSTMTNTVMAANPNVKTPLERDRARAKTVQNILGQAEFVKNHA